MGIPRRATSRTGNGLAFAPSDDVLIRLKPIEYHGKPQNRGCDCPMTLPPEPCEYKS